MQNEFNHRVLLRCHEQSQKSAWAYVFCDLEWVEPCLFLKSRILNLNFYIVVIHFLKDFLSWLGVWMGKVIALNILYQYIQTWSGLFQIKNWYNSWCIIQV